MLSLDVISLGVPDVQAAHVFYKSAFSPAADDHGQYVDLDMHGTGQVALHGTEALAAEVNEEPASSGFRGYVLSFIVEQPSEVEALVEAAVQGGAKIIKPAKKGIFGGFSAVYQAPDGAVWKLAAPSKKDTGPAGSPPVPTETAAFLGVAEPKVSKTFYEAVGMTVDRDYGNKFVDFRLNTGSCRFGLMQRKALAKDAGVDEKGSGFRAAIFTRKAENREEVNAVLKAADAAGGTILLPAAAAGPDGYCGYFSDLDGFTWKVAAA